MEQTDRIDAAIAQHRAQYLRAIWAGHDGEAEFEEQLVDDLLDERNRVVRAPVIT